MTDDFDSNLRGQHECPGHKPASNKETDYVEKLNSITMISRTVRDIYIGFIDVGFEPREAYELAYIQFKYDLELRNKLEGEK